MVSQDVLALILVYSLIVVALAICIIKLHINPNSDIRKIVHIIIGNFVFIWWMFSDWWIMDIFFTIPFIIILLYVILKKDKSSVIGKATSEASNTGLLFYAVSIAVLVTFFFNHFVAASVGIVAMTYGDSMGNIIGKRYGKHKIIHDKSLEGSLAVFIFTAIMGFIVITFYSYLIATGNYSFSSADAIIPAWIICIFAGTFASIIELFTPGNIDNLLVPIGITVLLCLLGM